MEDQKRNNASHPWVSPDLSPMASHIPTDVSSERVDDVSSGRCGHGVAREREGGTPTNHCMPPLPTPGVCREYLPHLSSSQHAGRLSSHHDSLFSHTQGGRLSSHQYSLFPHREAGSLPTMVLPLLTQGGRLSSHHGTRATYGETSMPTMVPGLHTQGGMYALHDRHIHREACMRRGASGP